jgi:hypothetical protein
VYPALISAALGDGSNASILLEFVSTLEAITLFAERDK